MLLNVPDVWPRAGHRNTGDKTPQLGGDTVKLLDLRRLLLVRGIVRGRVLVLSGTLLLVAPQLLWGAEQEVRRFARPARSVSTASKIPATEAESDNLVEQLLTQEDSDAAEPEPVELVTDLIQVDATDDAVRRPTPPQPPRSQRKSSSSSVWITDGDSAPARAAMRPRMTTIQDIETLSPGEILPESMFEEEISSGGLSDDCGCDSHSGSSCGSSGGSDCGSSCGSGCCALRCRRGGTMSFGEYLFLQPGGVDVPFSQPVDGLGGTAVPVGAVGVANPGYSSGMRVGIGWSPWGEGSVVGSFTWFSSNSVDSVQVNSPNVLRSLITHPNTQNSASDSLLARSQYDIDFQFADVDWRAVWHRDRNYVVHYRVGARYGRLEQEFRAEQAISPGTTSVATDINFDGGGIRFGLDGESKSTDGGFFLYGNAMANFLVGRYRSSYRQFNTFAQTQAYSRFEDDRIVPILESELGCGWTNRRGTIRLSAGYRVAAWFNTVSTSELISAVQSNRFADASDTITFDGLVARIEFRK